MLLRTTLARARPRVRSLHSSTRLTQRNDDPPSYRRHQKHHLHHEHHKHRHHEQDPQHGHGHSLLAPLQRWIRASPLDSRRALIVGGALLAFALTHSFGLLLVGGFLGNRMWRRGGGAVTTDSSTSAATLLPWPWRMLLWPFGNIASSALPIQDIQQLQRHARTALNTRRFAAIDWDAELAYLLQVRDEPVSVQQSERSLFINGIMQRRQNVIVEFAVEHGDEKYYEQKARQQQQITGVIVHAERRSGVGEWTVQRVQVRFIDGSLRSLDDDGVNGGQGRRRVIDVQAE